MSMRETIWISKDRTGEHVYWQKDESSEVDGKHEYHIRIMAQRDVMDVVYFDENEIELTIKPGTHLYDILKNLKQ